VKLATGGDSLRTSSRKIAAFAAILLAQIVARAAVADDVPPEHPGVARGLLKGHTDQITCVTVGRDGIVATGSADNTARIWDPSTGKETFVLQH